MATATSKSFTCRVVTPAEQLLDETVNYASIPVWDGLMGVLPGRAPIVARLGIGELKLDLPDASRGVNASRSYFINGGFMQMQGDTLIILAEDAHPAEELSESEAQAELAEAEARKVSPDSTDKAAEADRLRDARDAARWKVRLAKQSKARGI